MDKPKSFSLQKEKLILNTWIEKYISIYNKRYKKRDTKALRQKAEKIENKDTKKKIKERKYKSLEEKCEDFMCIFQEYKKYAQPDRKYFKSFTRSQLTLTEKIIDYLNKEKIDMKVFIVCQFKALSWKDGAIPYLSSFLNDSGFSNYEQHKGEVESEFAKEKFMQEAEDESDEEEEKAYGFQVDPDAELEGMDEEAWSR